MATTLLRGRAELNAGIMPFWMGDDARASERFGQALETGRRLGDAPLTSQALGGLARVALRTDVAEGRRLAREALAVSDAAGDEAGRSNALHLLGVGAQIAGDLVEAREWMTQRLALVRATGNDFLISSEAAISPWSSASSATSTPPRRSSARRWRSNARTGGKFMTPFAISGLASIATERGEFERAATLVGAAEAIMEAQQMAWPPDERPHYEQLLADLPEAMGADAFERARSRGRAMPASEAVEFALGSQASATSGRRRHDDRVGARGLGPVVRDGRPVRATVEGLLAGDRVPNAPQHPVDEPDLDVEGIDAVDVTERGRIRDVGRARPRRR